MELPQSIPDYILTQELGCGAFGMVYRARAKSDDTRDPQGGCAVKIISPSGLRPSTQTKDRFLREVDALHRLTKSPHKGIVRLITAGFTHDTPELPYLVMQFVAGTPLGRISPHMSFESRVAAIADVAEALEHAHSHSVFHRDIKPGNIIMGDSGPVVLDFGLAYVFESTSGDNLTQSAIGTMGYVPPEVQANPSIRNPKHDIYSCGITLYELLTGSRPVASDLSSLSKISDSLVGLDDIIRRTLARECDRYGSAMEFSAALRGWLANQTAQSEIPHSPRLATFRKRLIDSMAAADNQAKAAAARRQSIDSQIAAHHSSIAPIALRAMNDLVSQVRDIRPNYGLELIRPEHPLITPSGTATTIPYFAIDSGPAGRKLVFAVEWDVSPQKWGRKDGDLLDWKMIFAPQAKRPPIHYEPPCWVLYSEGKGKPAERNLQGVIVACIPSADVQKQAPSVVLFRNRMVSEANKHVPPEMLNGPQDIYEYFIYVLTATMS